MTHRALITGATGFVGACLTRHLIKKGWNVHLILRQQSGQGTTSQLADDVVIHRTDGNYASIEAAVASSKPDVVFHLASLFLAQHKPDDIGNLIGSNIFFPSLVLEAMSRCGIKNLVNTGTSWQHYQNKDCCPVNLYASTKAAFERLIEYYVDAHGLKVSTLKLFDTYGPGDKRKKLFYLLRNAALTGEPLNMSPGDQQVNLVYGEDVAEAFLLAGIELINKSSTFNHVYGVANNKSISLRDLVTQYCDITRSNIQVIWGALPYRPREVMIPWSDFIDVPGWTANTSLKAGIIQMESDSSIRGLLSHTN